MLIVTCCCWVRFRVVGGAGFGWCCVLSIIIYWALFIFLSLIIFLFSVTYVVCMYIGVHPPKSKVLNFNLFCVSSPSLSFGAMRLTA